jgi:hypothetical protein
LGGLCEWAGACGWLGLAPRYKSLRDSLGANGGWCRGGLKAEGVLLADEHFAAGLPLSLALSRPTGTPSGRRGEGMGLL